MVEIINEGTPEWDLYQFRYIRNGFLELTD